MKSNNNSELNKDDDLIFKPLNIKDPFKPDNSLFLSPLNARELNIPKACASIEPQSSTLDINYINNKLANIYRANNNPDNYGNWGDYSKLFEESANNTQTSMSTPPITGPVTSFGGATPGVNLSLPNLNVTPPTNTSMTPGTGTMSPTNTSITPGISIPSTTGGLGFTGASNANIGIPNALNLPPLPLTPYPPSIPSLDLEDLNKTEELTPSSNLQNNSTSNSNEDLYSYNDPEYSINTTNEINSNSVNAIDILRNFDFSYDCTIDENRNDITSKDIDKIFEEIAKNHPGILATMKAYRIPYPISKVLIKKIIYITAKYNKK